MRPFITLHHYLPENQRKRSLTAMNNTFNIRRFGLYARKEFRENWKAYALGLVGLTAILGYNIFQEWGFVHTRYNIGNSYHVDIYPYLATIMGLAVWIAGSYSLKSFSTKKETLSALTVPVSSLERFLYAWIMTVPISMLVCYIIWKMAWFIAFPYSLSHIPKVKIVFKSDIWSDNPYFSVFILGGSAAFMWGALALGRLNFLKTLGILIVVGLLFEWGQNRLLKAIFPADFSINSYSSIPWLPQTAQIKYQGVYSSTFHSTFENIYGFWWILCVPLLLYVITYLKIKEKEV